MRMKSLPSLRKNKRYVVFRIHSGKDLDYFNAKDVIWNSLTNWIGERDLAAADVWIIKNLWKKKGGTGYIRCNHDFVDSVIVALSLIHQIGDEKVVFQVLKISGTIKSGKKKLKEG